jgi:hypothetical protein
MCMAGTCCPEYRGRKKKEHRYRVQKLSHKKSDLTSYTQRGRGHNRIAENWGRHNNFWVGHRKFLARITNFKFQTESKAPFCPSPPAAQKEKFYVIASPTSCQVESGCSWATHLLSKEYNRLGVVTDHSDTEHSKICKCSSCPRNTLNIMPITNNIFYSNTWRMCYTKTRLTKI